MFLGLTLGLEIRNTEAQLEKPTDPHEYPFQVHNCQIPLEIFIYEEQITFHFHRYQSCTLGFQFVMELL